MIPIVYLRFSDGSQGVATPKMRAALASYLVQVEALGYTSDLRWSVTLDVGGDVVLLRELDPSQPQDQREIWRLAALKLGHTEAEAAACHMLIGGSRDPFHPNKRGMLWSWAGQVADLRLYTIKEDLVGDDLESATRALCARVWP